VSDDLKAAQRELNGKVMGREGVAGTAIGEKGGRPCLKVYLEKRGAGGAIPKKVRGVPVVIEVTGGFRRL
jgi:hypothetical protein